MHGGPCLQCRNRIEVATPDDVVIERLRNVPAAARVIEAKRVGVDISTLETFLLDPQGHCGMISGETLQKFFGESTQEEWSVGFVSLLAGVLLAAEYIKLSINPTRMTLDAHRNTFRFQFWHPESAEVNKIIDTPPEGICFCQNPIFCQAMKALWQTDKTLRRRDATN